MNVAIWTDSDLDGAGCALILSLLFSNDHIDFFEWSYSQPGEVRGWLTNQYDNYDKIFFTDISIPEDLIKDVDREKIVIIDHHESHHNNKDLYKSAKTFISNTTSCTRLLQSVFEKKLSTIITPEQEKILSIIDDYDSYNLKYPETLKLNAIFSLYNKPRVVNFIKNFKEGIREFNTQELNSIKLTFNRLKEEISNLEFYFGTIKEYKVVSCYTQGHATNEITHYALKKTESDIAIAINLKTNNVSFRKTKRCPLNLEKLAKALCDGGGHEYAAGGKITETFLKFTKTLKC